MISEDQKVAFVNMQPSSQANEDELSQQFNNALKIFYSDNEQLSAADLPLLCDCISTAVDLRRNDDANKLIAIGYTLSDNDVTTTQASPEVVRFFDVCSAAFNLTRNLDEAIKLLRKVEQRPDVGFSVTLFAHVLE